MGSSDGDRRNGIGVEGERWRSVENGVNNIEEVKLIGFSKEFKSKEYLEREERARVFALWSWWTVLPFSEVRNPGSRTSFRDQSRRRKVMALIFNILSLRWCWSILEKFQVDSEIHEHGAKKKKGKFSDNWGDSSSQDGGWNLLRKEFSEERRGPCCETS